MIFEEVGYDAQFTLFERVAHMAGSPPAVIDAADLEASPADVVNAYCLAMEIPFIPSALQWSRSVPDQLSSGDPWHADLFTTTGFERSVEVFDRELHSHPRYEEFCERSMPFYEAMKACRIAPAPLVEP